MSYRFILIMVILVDSYTFITHICTAYTYIPNIFQLDINVKQMYSNTQIYYFDQIDLSSMIVHHRICMHS